MTQLQPPLSRRFGGDLSGPSCIARPLLKGDGGLGIGRLGTHEVSGTPRAPRSARPGMADLELRSVPSSRTDTELGAGVWCAAPAEITAG